jgi:replicative DNA helicase
MKPIINFDLGKIPPQAIDAEEMVLGTCLSYPDAIAEINIKPEMFYKDANQKIFRSIIELSKKGACDIISITDYLNKKGELDQVGGVMAIMNLTNKVISDKMIMSHALIVKEKYLLREYIRIGCELQSQGFTEDLADISEFAESELFKLSDCTQTKEPKKVGLCIDELLLEIQKIYNKEKSLVGVPSGFTSIDRITGGWQPGNLIIIAGRPSMGKTALALALALNPAKMGYPVCFFSLEMSESEISTRYLSGVSGYTNVEIRNAKLDFKKLCKKSNEIAELPILIDDTPALSLFELRSKVKKVILRYGVKLLIIDYLQLMKADAGNREQEVSIISRGLKAISKEFSIPVIALSQLNRGVEDRADRRPRLSDLRESGAIEQDADIVGFVYRPSYYSIKTIELNGSDIATDGLMIIDCAKDRNGALFSEPLYHNSSLTVIQEKQFEMQNEFNEPNF